MIAAVIVEDMVLDRRAKGVPFVLSQYYLEISAGDAIGVVGPSGCGKSTLLDLIALILRPSRLARLAIAKDSQALLELRDQALYGSADQLAQWRSRLIGYVLQTGGLLPFATVRENIALPRRLLGLPDNGIVGHLAKRLEITDLLDRWPEHLSVGQRQRVAVARALAHEPKVLIADEPTASLDPSTGDLTMQLMIDACYSSSATLIVATHDLERAHRFKLRLLRFTPSGEKGSFAYVDDNPA